MRHMLVRVGWKPDFVEKSVPVLPISGWMGDNLIKKSEKMTWWSGADVLAADGAKVHVDTLLDALNNFVQVRGRWAGSGGGVGGGQGAGTSGLDGAGGHARSREAVKQGPSAAAGCGLVVFVR